MPVGSQPTNNMKNKAPISIEEAASLKDEVLRTTDSTESYEEMVADIAKQLQERAQLNRQVVPKAGKVKSATTPKKKQSAKKTSEEPLSIDQELRLLAGSEEAYERMLANLYEQMAHIAKTRGRFDLKNNRFVPIEKPKSPRKPRSKGNRAEQGGTPEVK